MFWGLDLVSGLFQVYMMGYFLELRLYFFIATQIAHIALPMR